MNGFRRIPLLVALIACSVILEPAVSRAAEMRLTPIGDFYFVGAIVSGDLERFRAALKASPDVHTINLRSPGGSVVEAIKVGRAIKNLYLDTAAPSGPAVGPPTNDNC